MWEVLKFGGSSLSSKGFRKIANIIINIQNSNIVIVLSAINKITNLLIRNMERPNVFDIDEIKEIHMKIISDLGITNSTTIIEILDQLETNIFIKNKDKDLSSEIIATGELLSSQILSQYLTELNTKNLLIDSRQIIISESSKDNNSDIFVKGSFSCNINKFQELVGNHNLIIMQGFISGTIDNKTALLTRGGSDTSATLIANMLSSSQVYIYTDVNGIYTTDPNKISNAKIIENIDYDIAQELSAMGAQVLHPYSIKPAQEKNIEIVIRNTYNHNLLETKINNSNSNQLAITNLSSVTLFHIKSLNMWNNYGFVYDIFKDFSNHNIDINIITTSQFIISCTTEERNKSKIYKVFNELKQRYQVELVSDCNMISVVGKNLCNISEKLFNITKNYPIQITHISSNKLSISFIIEQKFESLLHNDLHELIVPNYNKWWKKDINYFQSFMKHKNLSSVYFYSIPNITFKCQQLKEKLFNIDCFYYAMKANYHLEILKTITQYGFGLECVSINEIKIAIRYTNNIIFTPNFCKIEEYQYAFDNNCKVIVDNLEILDNDIFKNRDIGLRLDPIYGDGHHLKAITAGNGCKFGIDIMDIEKVIKICNQNQINVIGLHSHKGSGINNPNLWGETCKFLLSFLDKFPNIEWLNLGGGLAIDINLQAVNQELIKPKKIKLFLEPGRYLVSTSGVLVSEVTQCKTKRDKSYVGIATGMNSLIRPALYNAYHPIHNITSNKNTQKYTVVGPICESGDILGENVVLPETQPGDYLLIEQCGAYGYSMSSNYNLRKPACEEILFN